MAKKKIAIFCGGPSSEHEVSLHSSQNIFELIDVKKYSVCFFYITRDLTCRFAKNISELNDNSQLTMPFLEGLSEIKSEGYFALLAGLHGEFVEDGQIQTLLSYFKIPYSGSGPAASSLAMDKYRSSLLAESLSEIKLPKTKFIRKGQDSPHITSFPLVVKPNRLGSSVGVYIVKNDKTFITAVNKLKKDFPKEDILVQEYINGLEITCGVLQKKDQSMVMLPPIEIIPQKNDFFDYDSKYLVGGSTEITPPVSIDKNFSDKISKLASVIHTLLGLKTYSRSDFMIKGKDIYYLETNTLPGMTSTSLIPQEAKAIGLSFSQLLDFLINNS